jgi:uncharacterized membrane protein YkvA (DUF1232 family)
MSDQIGGEITSPVTPASNAADQSPREPIAGHGSADLPPGIDAMWQLIKRLPSYARVATAMARDSRVPPKSKAMMAAGGIYLVSPIDFVPGFIPVAGQLDDLYVVLLGLQQAIRTSPAEVVEQHFATVGLTPANVDKDLATIRAFVRRGVAWTMQKGGQALSRASRKVSAFAQRTRQVGGTTNDQTPL